MFPRFQKTYGECVVSGTATKSIGLRTVLTEHKSGLEHQTFSVTLAANTSFTFTHNVPAKLCEYDLTIFYCEKDSAWKTLQTIQNLVAGDFFIVSGQSNAECGIASGGHVHDSVYFCPWNRAIGANMNVATSMNTDSTVFNPIEFDCLFGRAHSEFWHDGTRAYSGVWPVKIQHSLSHATGIPICVVNGSRGGTPIVDFYASHTPSIPDSLEHSPDYKKGTGYKLYDRLYKKLFENEAVSAVKGIFWYQGETDATFDRDSAWNYEKRFEKLYTSWLADYPNLEKVIVLQLNTGCAGLNSGVIREVQRRMPQKFSKVLVMSTVGSSLSDRQSDLCHYTLEGYSGIADKLIPLAKKHFYGFNLSDEEILPPNIRSVVYTSPTQLTLEFDNELFCQDSTWYADVEKSIYLKDYFFNENYEPLQVKNLGVEQNKIMLEVDTGAKPISKLTYLPHAFSHLPTLYAGPWIFGAKNPTLGAYSFFEFPVETNFLMSTKRTKGKMEVFPNPVEDKISIIIPVTNDYEYEMINAGGIVVLTGTLKAGRNEVSVETLDPGFYILKLQHEGQCENRKVIVN